MFILMGCELLKQQFVLLQRLALEFLVLRSHFWFKDKEKQTVNSGNEELKVLWRHLII